MKKNQPDQSIPSNEETRIQRDDKDDNDLKRSQLDDIDDDGTPLNEKSSASDQSGRDLDVPGADDDDDNEDIGEEDEENNEYSLPKQED